jgi:hypothetical protein
MINVGQRKWARLFRPCHPALARLRGRSPARSPVYARRGFPAQFAPIVCSPQTNRINAGAQGQEKRLAGARDSALQGIGRVRVLKHPWEIR